MRRFLENPLGVCLAAMWTVTGILLVLGIAWPTMWIRVPAGIAAIIALLTHAYVFGPAERRARTLMNRVTAVLGDLSASGARNRLTHDVMDAVAERTELLRESLDRERRLRVSMERSIGAILDAVPSPVLLVDRSGQVLMGNAGAGAIVGRDRSMLAGRMLDEILPRAEVLALHQTASRGETARTRARIETVTGVATFEVAAVPTDPGSIGSGGYTTAPPRPSEDDGLPGAVLLSFIDVTELAAAIELKTDFVANASHELRTPVASISAALDSLSGPKPPDPATQARVVNLAKNNLVRLQELIRDLLDLARLESPNVAVRTSAVSVDAIRERMRSRFAELLSERGVSLVFEVQPGLDRLQTDAGLLDLIVANLIDNATKFAFEGTPVRVILERRDSTNGTGGAGSPGNGTLDELRLRVVDKGIGIPLNQQQRIFERFYQIDEARSGNTRRRGTGLGLAIVKHAVRTLGGQISVESVWQEGTTMAVVIPNAVPRASSSATQPDDSRGDDGTAAI